MIDATGFTPVEIQLPPTAVSICLRRATEQREVMWGPRL